MSQLEPVFEYYQVYGNVDQTEGKGGMRVVATYVDEEQAVNWAKSKEGQDRCGVMGYGYGRVMHVRFYVVRAQGVDTVQETKTEVWGYRKDWNGRMTYGWIDLRDQPDKDPEWDEYQRLREKFKTVDP